MLDKLNEIKNELMAEYTNANEEARKYAESQDYITANNYMGQATAYVDAMRKIDILILMYGYEAENKGL